MSKAAFFIQSRATLKQFERIKRHHRAALISTVELEESTKAALWSKPRRESPHCVFPVSFSHRFRQLRIFPREGGDAAVNNTKCPTSTAVAVDTWSGAGATFTFEVFYPRSASGSHSPET